MRYHRKLDGTNVPFTPEEEAIWDAMDAQNAIQKQYEDIRDIRDTLISSDLNGFQMKNPDDIVNIQQTIQGLEAIPEAKILGLIPQDYPEVVSFRKSDNTFQTMTLADMKNLYLQYLLRKQQAWSNFQNAIETLQNS